MTGHGRHCALRQSLYLQQPWLCSHCLATWRWRGVPEWSVEVESKTWCGCLDELEITAVLSSPRVGMFFGGFCCAGHIWNLCPFSSKEEKFSVPIRPVGSREVPWGEKAAEVHNAD